MPESVRKVICPVTEHVCLHCRAGDCIAEKDVNFRQAIEERERTQRNQEAISDQARRKQNQEWFSNYIRAKREGKIKPFGPNSS